MEMKRYQSGIADFTDKDAVVFGVSTDALARNKEFAESLELGFVLLSDEEGKVAGDYGVLMDNVKIAKRTTFVVDPEGNIAYIATGGEAMDPNGAAAACAK